MAGLIRKEDIEAVRERVRIDEVVGEHVTLKPAGLGALKGLCPFHDERTPSFQVRPQVGFYHCFGCGEGGDAIKFLMTLEHLSFVESVERLAQRAGVELRYEEGGGPDRAESGRRQRLLDANAAAEAFFREQLSSPEANTGRVFLHERGFDQAAAEQFGVGYAPKGWDSLLKHLRGRGLHRHRPRHVRADVHERPRSVRPVPWPAGLADPRHHRRHSRFRRAQAVRRRPGTEVPQHPADAGLQQERRALRHRPRQARDRRATSRSWSSRATPT